MSKHGEEERARLHAIAMGPVLASVARDLKVHVLAANAGAELITERELLDVLAERGYIAPRISAGWAAWYASGDELP